MAPPPTAPPARRPGTGTLHRTTRALSAHCRACATGYPLPRLFPGYDSILEGGGPYKVAYVRRWRCPIRAIGPQPTPSCIHPLIQLVRSRQQLRLRRRRRIRSRDIEVVPPGSPAVCCRARRFEHCSYGLGEPLVGSW